MKYNKIFKILLFLSIFTKMISCYQSSFLRHKQEASNTDSAEDINDLKESEKFEPSVYRGHCLVKIKNYFYDLNQLSSKNGYFVKGKNGQTVSFNFCKNVPTQCEDNEGLVVSTSRCCRYAKSQNTEKIWIREEDSKKNTILTLILPEGDICEKNRTSVIRYQTSFQIKCDKDIEFLVTNEKSFDQNKCQNTIKLKSKFGKISF